MFGCIWACDGVFPLTLPSTSLDFTRTYSALAVVLLYFSIFSNSSNFLTFLASSWLDLGFDWCYYRQWNYPFQLFSVKPCAHTQLLSEAKTAARAQLYLYPEFTLAQTPFSRELPTPAWDIMATLETLVMPVDHSGPSQIPVFFPCLIKRIGAACHIVLCSIHKDDDPAVRQDSVQVLGFLIFFPPIWYEGNPSLVLWGKGMHCLQLQSLNGRFHMYYMKVSHRRENNAQ